MNMKSKISTGIWLIFFGIIALLDNFNVLNFNFYAILKYWPLLIISLGINLIFQYKNYGTAIIVAVNLALCVFLAVIGYTSDENFNWKGKVVYNSKNLDSSNAEKTVHIPLADGPEEPKFTFNIGASTVLIDKNTAHFLEASSGSKNLGFSLSKNANSIELDAIISDKSSKNHMVKLGLNTAPIWDLTFNIGASRFDADLKDHKFSNLEINSGAASVGLVLGHPAEEKTEIEINTAASSCKISLPKDVACSIEMTTILSSNKLSGFTKKDGIWQTDNYESASKKYIINLNGAANSLRIDRY